MKMIGNFAEVGKAIASDIKKHKEKLSKATYRAAEQASEGLKKDLRADTIGAGLGPRLANTWQNKGKGGKTIYPDRSRAPGSLDVTAYIFSKAPEIIQGYAEGATIRAKSGRYMAMPTDDVPLGFKGKRITPEEFKQRIGPLFSMYMHGHLVLVATVRKSYSAKTGKFRGYKKASARWVKSGKETQTVVMYVLIKQISLKKRLNIQQRIEYWSNKMADLITEGADAN